MRVDLPAALSPTRPRTSPWRSVSVTSSRAFSPPKDLRMLLISSRQPFSIPPLIT